MDLVATTVKHSSNFYEYGTGLAMEIPKGYVGLLFQDLAYQMESLLEILWELLILAIEVKLK